MSSHLGVRMSNHASAIRTPVLNGLLLTGSSVVAAGAGFAITMLVNHTVALWLLVPVSAAGMGLIAGAVSRFILEQRSTLTRWLVAMTSLFLGLITLHWFSAGLLGVQLEPGRLSQPDWLGLAQVGLGGFSAWLTLTAWRHKRVASPELELSTPSLRVGEPVQSRPARLLAPPPVRVQRPLRWKRNQRTSPPVRIKMSSVLEHRCPYCLELVADDDPRGVQVCSICGAWHHADCWAVTGTCQVPHQNEL